jgi:hypothetical protein
MTACVLIAPAGNSHLFFRSDHDSRRWFVHPNLMPFHALLPGLVQIMSGEAGPDLVISTFRGEELLNVPPDDFDLADRAVTEILCPLGDPGSPSIWGWLCYHSAERAPIAGDRFVQRQLPDVLKAAFPQTRLDELKKPAQSARRELWIRRNWLGLEIAPEVFPTVKLNLSDDDAGRTAAVAAGARAARTKAASKASAAAGEFNKASAKAYAEKQAKARAAK